MDFFSSTLSDLSSFVNIHPMIIHFPIVLLFIFLAFYSLTLFSQKLISQWINFGIWFGLALFSLLSKKTGEDAGILVGPTLVNPRALTGHAANALDFIWSVMAIGLAFFIVEFIIIKKELVAQKFFFYFRSIVLIIGLFSTVLLVKTGHTGATLVYKYAAGVDIPLKRAEKIVEQNKISSDTKSNRSE